MKHDILVNDCHDDGEQVMLMEPMTVSQSNAAWSELNDLAFVLLGKAKTLAGRPAPEIVVSIGDLVRSMNCYYSNLIEGHDTHPIDFDQALKTNFDQEPEKRNLQKEALAHIGVQKWIDCSDEMP